VRALVCCTTYLPDTICCNFMTQLSVTRIYNKQPNENRPAYDASQQILRRKVLQKLTVANVNNKLFVFDGTRRFITCSHQPATGSCPQPDGPSTHLPIALSKTYLNIIHQPMSSLPSSVSISDCLFKSVCVSHLSVQLNLLNPIILTFDDWLGGQIIKLYITYCPYPPITSCS
jgi:hypothetical protein